VALPVASFLIDSGGTVLPGNQLGRRMIHETAEGIAADPRRAGELLHCVHAENDLGGCGRGHACPTCELRGVVGEAMQGGKAAHRQLTLALPHESAVRPVPARASAAPITYGGNLLAVVTLSADALVEQRAA